MASLKILAVAFGSASIFLLWNLRKRQGNFPKESYKDVLSSVKATAKEDFESEQLARNIAFFGAERMEQVRVSFVIIVGLGGVGSHAAHMLLRSGIKKLRFIDFDQVTLSSLNRHAVANHRG